MMRATSCWSGLTLLLGLLVLYSGNGGGLSEPPTPPPSSAPVAPNASLITAKVLKYSVWNGVLLELPQETTLYSLVLEVLTSEPVSPRLLNLVRPGDRIEAFSKEALAPELFGKEIEARVRLAGDERGQRFWVSGIQVLNPSGEED